jgi:hypothetical protein
MQEFRDGSRRGADLTSSLGSLDEFFVKLVVLHFQRLWNLELHAPFSFC